METTNEESIGRLSRIECPPIGQEDVIRPWNREGRAHDRLSHITRVALDR
jgi:hypothetical protein